MLLPLFVPVFVFGLHLFIADFHTRNGEIKQRLLQGLLVIEVLLDVGFIAVVGRRFGKIGASGSSVRAWRGKSSEPV